MLLLCTVSHPSFLLSFFRLSFAVCDSDFLSSPLPIHFRSFSIDATRNYAGRTHEEYTIAYRVLLLRECITRVMCVKYETTRVYEFIKRQSHRADLRSFPDGNLHTEKSIGDIAWLNMTTAIKC